MSARLRGEFGIDAPWVPRLWGGMAAASALLAVVFGLVGLDWAVGLAVYFAVLAVLSTAGMWLYLRASLRGKFEVWRELIERLPLRGDERALDLGCGHGAVAILLAERLPDGHITGIDLWRSIDQSRNSAEAARRNAVANAVDSRVTFDTGDMTALPYPDASFDLVTASLAIHNIPTPDGRRRAVHEAVRTLRPGGRLLIVDIQRVREYEDAARKAGMDVQPSSDLGWRVWWTGPWMATRALEAVKGPAT